VSKSLHPWWHLQALVDGVVARIAPDCGMFASVAYNENQIELDGDCEEVGRVPWHCDYFFSCPDEETARALVPILGTEIARLQARYDLGLTFG
jgi:hypothetical protein